MKKNNLHPVLILCILLFYNFFLPNHISAQEEIIEVKISSQKVRRHGKEYFLHIVQPGQNIFRISIAYNVSIQDIVDANPGIQITDIKAGQPILIPTTSSRYKLQESFYGLSKRDFIYHKVKRKQTVFYISRKYDVPEEVIYKFNPGSENGIQIDQILKIPKNKVIDKILKKDTLDIQKYYYYQVKHKDTLYSLSKIYGVSVSTIIEHNPDLKFGLKAGMIIRIPKLITKAEPVDTLMVDSIIQFSQAFCDSIRKYHYNQKLKIAVILPFMSDLTKQYTSIFDSVKLHDGTYKKVKRKPQFFGKFSFELYQGILLAIDSLKNSTNVIKIYTFDNNRDTTKTKLITDKLQEINPDLIIGPIFAENIKIINEYAKEKNIPIISLLYPFSSLLENNPNIIQITPSKKTELKFLAKNLITLKNKNLIIIHGVDTNLYWEIDYLKQQMKQIDEADSIYEDFTIKEIYYDEMNISQNINHALNKELENVVVILFSEPEGFVSSILAHLYYIKDFKISVVGNASLLAMKKLDVEYFHKLQLSIYTPFYIEYNDISTFLFLKRAHRLLAYEPQEININGLNYTYLGYDVTLKFIDIISNYGNHWAKCICRQKGDYLLSDYTFFQESLQIGFQNIFLKFIHFNHDYSIDVSSNLEEEITEEEKIYLPSSNMNFYQNSK